MTPCYKQTNHIEYTIGLLACLRRQQIESEEKEWLLKKLEMINKQAIHHFIPVGEESDYFLFVNALQLLRNKIERN